MFQPLASYRTRECEECSVCCHVAQVKFQLETKPAYKKCLHVIDERPVKNGSCKIFGQSCRPSECNSFVCSWLGGMGQPKDRPDLSGVMLSVNAFNGGTWIVVVETEENAIFKSGRDIILEMIRKIEYPAIVSSFGKRPPHDKGDRVIVKSSLLPRCRSLIGAKLDELTDDVAIYELLDSNEER